MLQKQLDLERKMLDSGIERYNNINKKAEQAGRAAETSYAQRLIPSLCIDLASAIEDAKHTPRKIGQNFKYVSLIQRVDSTEAAFITLKSIFDSLIIGSALTSLAASLGTRIEDQIRFKIFEQDHELYYKRIMEDFKRKNTTAYRHMHRVLVNKATEKEDGWVSWTVKERIQLGSKLIELCILSTGICEKVNIKEGRNKTVARIVATEDALEWINDHVKHAEVLRPETGPCIIPPMDWKSLDDGGYFSRGLRRRVPFVKTKNTAHRKAIQDGDFTEHMQAINSLQKTPWLINTAVHDVMKEVWRRNLCIGMPPSEPIEVPECPFEKTVDLSVLPEGSHEKDVFNAWKRDAAACYTLERERVSKLIQLSRVMYMAEEYRIYAKFYFVYNCDFRGRLYTASPGLSPQGADFSKGLLHFADGVALGKEGAYWLAVQGANVFGYDKDTYDGRNEWVKSNELAILSVAANPLGSNERSFWGNADKPYQFLAFCFEWAGYVDEGCSYKSKLAVALDGSCNGLQHLSALLLDEVGGKAVNLTPSDKPQDVYKEVSDKLIDRLNGMIDEFAAQWLEVGITRKITKKPVMTLPYGSTVQGCRESIELFIKALETHPWTNIEKFKSAAFLSRIMWVCIGEVVIAARNVMVWLQQSSRLISKENECMIWVTSTGFKVYQGSMKMKGIRVDTQLCGKVHLKIRIPTDEVNPSKQANGIVPNFTHGNDAAHLVKTVNLGTAEGIQNWAVIHDSYGTYAGATPVLASALRRAFCSMYAGTNLLEVWKNEQEARTGVELPELPVCGNLNVLDVLDSPYFFG